MVSVNQLLGELNLAARSAASEYFEPLTWIADGIKKREYGVQSSEGKTQNSDETLSTPNAKANLTLLQNSICYNQSAIIEYAFLVAQKHKLIKEELYGSKPDFGLIRKMAKDLVDFLNRDFYEVTFKNFEFLHSYFSERRGGAPRVCVKGNFLVNDGQTVVSIFRDRRVNYNSDVPIKENTGFYFIKEHGRFFLENNMPEAVINRNYVNPRLDVARVKKAYKDAGGNLDGIVRNWDEFWHDYTPEKRGDASFYKSTLIIPLTLWNDNIDDDLRRLAQIGSGRQSICGYLCFDHRELDYFNDAEDVSVGYIFAYVLSIFVFTRMVYTKGSDTFKRIRTLLRGENDTLELETLPLNWREITAQTFADLRTQRRVGTKNNSLIPNDDILLKYARADRDWQESD
jgi:hypothetical protein